MYLKKLKSENTQSSRYSVSESSELFSAANVTCILGYESSYSPHPHPKKIYIIDNKTADVRVIFLFKELSHIL